MRKIKASFDDSASPRLRPASGRLIANERAYKTFAAWMGGGRLPHAILLEGPAGCGKTAFAGQLAKAALCEPAKEPREAAGLFLPGEIGNGSPEGGRPCGVCRHCVKVEKNIHPDILLFEGEGRARSFHIETVREIRSKAFVYPNEGGVKVFILRNVQDMSVQAQNALLKILEEPPPAVIFILTCENKSVMLETILSRTVSLQLELPGVKECSEYLEKQKPGLEPGLYNDCALSAGGNIGKALELLEKGSAGLRREAGELWRCLLEGRELDALALLSGYERDRKALQELLAALRVLASGSALSPEPEGGPAPRHSPLRLIEIVDIIDEIAASCAGNANCSLLGTLLCARAVSALNR